MIRSLIFWLALGLILYAYVGFPILLLLRSRLMRALPQPQPPSQWPRVSLIVVAHNEAHTIGAKIENTNAVDYPRDRLETIIASDGSTDGTDDLVAAYLRPGLRLLSLPRTGKIPALNAAVAQAQGEILVFSDANSMYAPDALRALVAPFADPQVGAVGGNQCYVRDGAEHLASFGERLYWEYDRMLKRAQSHAGSITAATGAIHAVRRQLFATVPLGVSDDFITSTRAVLHGHRLAFAPDAKAYETVAPSEGAEFKRKLRIIVRGLRGVWIFRQLFNPLRYGFYSLQLFSHKLLRWSVCWLLLACLASALSLYAAPGVYRWAAQAQLGFYAAAAIGMGLHHTRWRRYRLTRVFGIPFYFCLANYAALQAWLQVISGKRVDAWSSGRAGLDTTRTGVERGVAVATREA